jgi:hypothetical protein
VLTLIRRHGIPILGCLVAGFAVALTPSFLWLSEIGKFIYIQSYDNLIYLALAAQPYYNHPFYLSDPTVQGGPTVYPWALFIPFVVIAHGLDLGAFGVNLVWEVLAAAGMALGSYFAFLSCVRRRWLAAACSVVLMVDCGAREGVPLLESARAFMSSMVVGAHSFFGLPRYDFVSPWRIVDPSVGLPFVLLNIGLVVRAVRRPTATSILLAGISTGLLFYIYFYFWTAVLLALAIALLLDRASYRAYAGTMLIGGILGLPSLISGLSVRRAVSLEGLQRMDLFIAIPHLLYLRPTYAWAFPRICAAVCLLIGLWIWKRGRTDLIYPWSIGAAGLLLRYNSLITGKQLAPYHWGYAHGPAVSFVVLAVVATELETLRIRKASLIFGVLFCTELAVSMYLRVSYAHHSLYANQVLSDYTRYIAQQEGPSHVALVGNSVVAGDDGFCRLAAIGDNQHPLASLSFLSVSLIDDEVEKRIAFNARLEGIGRAEFVGQANAILTNYAPATFNPAKGSALINGLLRYYDLAVPEMNQLAGEYAVRYVAIAIDRTDPRYLENGWRPIASGPYWRIWEREPF